ncbi:MAG: hypothetical protein HOV96_41010 [Nonomuraea sp.]|nr:hypothetical protein [Nonomuraea sp.]NUP83926.1 hypothetical protein [Nonomuraea sp.]NUS05042.1 hypothetical protein [Nonomuraea sp.]
MWAAGWQACSRRRSRCSPTPLGGLAAGAVGAWPGGHAVFVTGIAVMALSYLAVVTAPKVFHPV